MKRGLRKYVNAAFLCVLLSLLCWQCAWAEVFGGTEQEVYEAMVAMKAEYPEGMKYTNDDYYWDTQVYLDLNDNTSSRGGWGCGAFVWILSDAAFGDHAVTAVDRDYTKIRVGDVLRINGDTHSVIVLEVRDHSVIVAEGNYSGTIHWGRELDFSRFASDPQFERISRWPAASAVAEVLSSGSWKRDADGWYYEKADGARAKGWALISGAYYYFDEKTGIMWTGWALTADDRQTGDVCYLSEANDGTLGQLLGSEWKWVDGRLGELIGEDWYYLDANGELITDATGKLLPGWRYSHEVWYYLEPTGKYRVGWMQDTDGSWYYFKEVDTRDRSWMLSDEIAEIGGNYYYFDKSGRMQTGWHQNAAGAWNYFSKNADEYGHMMISRLVEIGGDYYYFDGRGEMRIGWYQDENDDWYLFSARAGEKGKMFRNIWVWNKDTDYYYLYYFDANGRMARNTTVDGRQLDAGGHWTVDGVIQKKVDP